MQEHDTPYTVTYEAPDGAVKTTAMMWTATMPDEREVALSVRDELLGENFLIPDAIPNDPEGTTVRQLRLAGFKILHVIRAL